MDESNSPYREMMDFPNSKVEEGSNVTIELFKTTRQQLFLYCLTFLSCIGGFLFGYDTGVISGALVLICDDFNLNDVQKELIVGITIAGALVSSSCTGVLSDKFGRKPVIMVSSLIFVVGSLLLSIFAVNYTSLIIGRFVVGLGVGAASMVMPLYVCEASPTNIRGAMVTYVNVAITFGQVFSACVDGAFAEVHEGWKWMLGLAAIPAAIQFIGFFFMPESPRWLLENNYVDQGRAVLKSIRNVDDAEEEAQDILIAIRLEKESAFFDEVHGAEEEAPGANQEDGNAGETRTMGKSGGSPPGPSARCCSWSWVSSSSSLSSVGISSTHDPSPGGERVSSSFLTKLCHKPVLRALFVGCCLQAAQQFGGINTVM